MPDLRKYISALKIMCNVRVNLKDTNQIEKKNSSSNLPFHCTLEPLWYDNVLHSNDCKPNSCLKWTEK